MRTFLLGLVLGAGTGALVTWRYMSHRDTAVNASAPALPVAATQPAPPSTIVVTEAWPKTPPPLSKDPVRPAPTATVAPPVSALTPVALSIQHAELMKRVAAGARTGDPTVESYHQQLEAEGLDHNWAYAIEEQLKAYLAKNAPSPDFDVTLIHCRTTLCEIQAFGYKEPAANDWMAMFRTMRKEPWWPFGQESSVTSEDNGRAVLLTILHKQ